MTGAPRAMVSAEGSEPAGRAHLLAQVKAVEVQAPRRAEATARA